VKKTKWRETNGQILPVCVFRDPTGQLNDKMMSTTSSPDLSLDFSSPIATPLLRKSGGRGRGLEAHQTETPPLPVMDPEIRELLARHNKSMLGKENAELGTPNGVNGPLSPFATPLLKPQHLKKIVFSKQPGSGIIGDQADTPVKPSPLSDSTGGVVNDGASCGIFGCVR
jgi:hypothetical protein